MNTRDRDRDRDKEERPSLLSFFIDESPKWGLIAAAMKHPHHETNVMGKTSKLGASEPPREPGTIPWNPPPPIWKISPVEGVLK